MSNTVTQNAPICNVQGVVQEPNQQVGIFQPIPKATDLASAIAAINAMANNLNNLFKQGAFSSTGGVHDLSTNNKKKPAAPSGNYREDPVRRVYKTVRVYNPQDSTQFVDVKQIIALTFVDPNTKRTIVWRQ